jgi:uracil-DNA glycosylase
MTITIIGQAPGARNGKRRAFEGRSGDRLAEAAGLRGHAELRRRADVTNLLRRFPGKSGRIKGDAFPMRRARRAARIRKLEGVVLLIGRGVARAFDVDAPFLRWVRRGDARIAVVPHPSGVNLWWNSAENRRRARRFLRRLFDR